MPQQRPPMGPQHRHATGFEYEECADETSKYGETMQPSIYALPSKIRAWESLHYEQQRNQKTVISKL